VRGQAAADRRSFHLLAFVDLLTRGAVCARRLEHALRRFAPAFALQVRHELRQPEGCALDAVPVGNTLQVNHALVFALEHLPAGAGIGRDFERADVKRADQSLVEDGCHRGRPLE